MQKSPRMACLIFRNFAYPQVDAFVGGDTKGNSAAVVLLSEWKDDKWLQDVATEFNLSETSYVVKKEKEVIKSENAEDRTEESGEQEEDSIVASNKTGESQPSIQEFDLRWFTPTAEVGTFYKILTQFVQSRISRRTIIINRL
jgi:hypothetical protein